jgi:hypothetical protein
MGVENTFNSFVKEIKNTIEKKQLTEELHDTFVMFVYTLYNFIVYHLMWFVTTIHRLVMTYLPLPKIKYT